MNTRNGLIAVGVIAVLAIIIVLIQSGNLSLAEGKIAAIQNTATAQQVALADQGTAAVATLSAASTQAVDAQQKAITEAANAAATTQASSLADAAQAAATAQAEAVSEAVNAASTMQAQALATASQAAATVQANLLKDAANSAATEQAKAVSNARNVAATRQAAATATLGIVLDAGATLQVEALVDVQKAVATSQARAVETVQAEATATLGAVILQAVTSAAKTQVEYHATEVAVKTQIAAINAELATAQANVISPTATLGIDAQTATERASIVSPTAEATEQVSVPADWKRYVDKGVAITLPKTYIGSELGSDPEALGKILRSLGPDFESAAALLESNPDILSFIAVNQGDGKQNLSASVIVVSIPLPTSIPMNTMLEATISQLPSGSKVLEKSVVQVGEYEAGRMIVETHVGTIVSSQLQYYIIANNTLYLVGFTGAPGHFDEQLPLFEQSMKTFEILAKPGT